MKSQSRAFDYNLIKFLIAVIETKSMSNAADLLDVAPSVVSYAVKKLREHYQDVLFIRSTNGVKPTIMAQGLYSKFKEIDFLLQQNLSLPEINSGERKKIIIRVDNMTEIYIVDKISENTDFMNNYTLEFSTSIKDSNQRNDALRRFEVDLDIGIVIIGDNHIFSSTLFETEMCAICGAGSKHFQNAISFEEFKVAKQVSYPSNYINTGLFTDLSELIDLRNSNALFVSDSFVSLILHMIVSDSYMFIPAIYYDVLRKFFDIKILESDFMPSHQLKFIANWNKNNANAGAIKSLIDILTVAGDRSVLKRPF